MNAPGSDDAPPPVSIETGCGPGVTPDPSEMTPELRRDIAEIDKRKWKEHVTTAWSISDDGKVSVRVVDGSRDLVPRPVLRTHSLF